MTTILVALAVMIALDIAALRWGIDSRRRGGDWRPGASGSSFVPCN